MVSNSVASWVVSGWWCFGFRSWCALMILEHLFQVVGMVLLVGKGTTQHLLLTCIGSVVGYLSGATSYVQAFRAEVSEREGKGWAMAVIVMVATLVTGMSATGYFGFVAFRRKLEALWRILSTPVTDFEDESALGRLDDVKDLSSTTPAGPAPEAAEDGSNSSTTTRELSRPGSNRSIASLKPGRPPFEDVDLKRLVGQGSFGKVYYGLWMGSPVAVKVVMWDSTKLNGGTAPIFEAQLSATLSHPCLVQTFKYSTRHAAEPLSEGDSIDSIHDTSVHIWIVQEWCDRGTLRQHCQEPRTDPSSLTEVAGMFADITAAGSYLHSRGIIHGDLSANNVLLKSSLSPKGYVCKVCDFGLARVLEGESTGILTSQLGTMTHMPPELFKLDPREAKMTPKVDIYSTGILLWQVITGRAPFQGLSLPQIVIRVSRGGLLKLPDEAPRQFRDVFDRCTNPDPNQRPSFDELVEFFSGSLSDTGSTDKA